MERRNHEIRLWNAGPHRARATGALPAMPLTGVTSESSCFRVRSSRSLRGDLRCSFFGVGGSGRKPPQMCIFGIVVAVLDSTHRA